MKKIKGLFAAVAVTLMLSGCGSSGSMGQQGTEVVGKVQTQPYFSEMSGPDGDFCSGPSISRTFSGQQVTLLDAEGKIIGVAKLEGWDGEGVKAEAAHLVETFGYNDGAMCSWDFSFSGVSLTGDFYTLEFSDSKVSPATITRQDLENGPVVVIG